ncbi:MAG TPA: hypothetical protein VNV44_05260 [Solirubrobacteraceae bacterium]|jgi:hypothetical protein|nr:hypothetical protein [Solirubrobacteraceae bacterium]
MLGATWSSFGALLIGVGALLLLADVLASGTGLAGLTWGGTQPQPSDRLSSGAETAGAALVAGGSAILLIRSHGLSVASVIVALALAASIIYLGMTAKLRDHMRLVAKENPEDAEAAAHATWRWCARHLLWKPS